MFIYRKREVYGSTQSMWGYKNGVVWIRDKSGI